MLGVRYAAVGEWRTQRDYQLLFEPWIKDERLWRLEPDSGEIRVQRVYQIVSLVSHYRGGNGHYERCF